MHRVVPEARARVVAKLAPDRLNLRGGHGVQGVVGLNPITPTKQETKQGFHIGSPVYCFKPAAAMSCSLKRLTFTYHWPSLKVDAD